MNLYSYICIYLCIKFFLSVHFLYLKIAVLHLQVSIFSPLNGLVYLNITKGNIQSFHYNSRLIN